MGFVLKPEFLRNSIQISDFSSPKFKNPKMVLKVMIVSGFNLPKMNDHDGIISPFVEISLMGLENDEITYNTRVIEKNGFNPV